MDSVLYHSSLDHQISLDEPHKIYATDSSSEMGIIIVDSSKDYLEEEND
jgi:hypothetical protein